MVMALHFLTHMYPVCVQVIHQKQNQILQVSFFWAL